MVRVTAALVLLGSLLLSAQALQLSRTLGSNMVLQRAPASARIWGFGTTGDAGRVTFEKNTLPFTVNGAGQWAVSLPPTAAGGPYNISIESTEGTILLSNVLFGDVWFCGGQSNMGMSVGYALNSTAEIAAMTEQNYPTVRIFHVNSNYFAYTPFQDLEPGQVGLHWQPVSPQNGGGFSAVCWFFGRDYYNDANKQIPVGLIQDQWGGTPVQAWSSPDAVAKCPNTTWQGDTVEAPLEVLGAGSQGDPSVLWNAMVVPYLNMALAGWTWYQGEQNVGVGPFHGPKYYACAFPQMIADWREKFRLPNAPFLFVQLAPWCAGPAMCNATTPTFSRDNNIPDLRLSQMSALQLPRVGWAIADDLGDMDPPAGSVHPRNKQPVGRRLAAAARNFIFGPTPFGGPLCSSAHANGSSIVLTTTSTSLRIVASSCPQGIQSAFCNGAGFEVSVDLSQWEQATAVELGPGPNQLSVRSPVAGAKWIRYKYIDWPVSTVVDANGFPMSVFFEQVQ